jgi:anti-anti-sigma regulatory factor
MSTAVEPPDLATVEALCALQLAARRLGCSIRVHDPSPELRELIVLAGLDELLLVPDESSPVPPSNSGNET